MEDEVTGDELSLDDTLEIEGEEVEEITFGDEPENENFADVRRFAKDKAREAAELKRQLAELQDKARPAPVDVGPEPTFEGCDYNEELFSAELKDWYSKKAAAEKQKAEIAKPDEELQQKFQAKVETFRTGVATLAFDDAQETVDGTCKVLNVAQQAAIVKAVKDPAKFMYALGRNPEKLASLAEHNDLAEFIADVVRLEMNMTTRKRPAADKPVSGNASPSTPSSDKAEAKLLQRARETGDYDAYYAHKRAKKAA